MLCFYFDEHIDPDIATGLRVRGIPVITTKDVQRHGLGILDDAQLIYAREHDYVTVTIDRDFIALNITLRPHAGIVMLHPNASIG